MGAASAAACLLLTVGLAFAQTPDLSKYFKLCSRNDPNLDQCVVETLTKARENLAKGIPELDLPPFDPFFVRSVRVTEGPGDIQLQFAIKNSTYTGLSEYTITRARFDVPKKYLELEMMIPKLVGKGRYSFGGQLLTLRIQGNGPYDIELTNVNVTQRIDFEEKTINGKAHWTIKKHVFDFDMADFKAQFRNLFRGNNRLGQYANTYINRNWRPGFTIYKNIIASSVGSVFANATNGMFEKVPLSQLFLS